ncbi:AEC family transporter [Jiangella asiatica]|uniref:AEC family transporter n=1 Tax=Jiangella asiatica TaxID=2530372 RepID=A0A4R5CN51_9ACTN|nr:AEC family transporter [Jiangella asiatica]TDE00141.1 AEC family transporter [Jiangella asiatica]
MPEVLSGFALLGVVVGIGYVLGRIKLLGDAAEVPLSRLSFSVAAPALLFTILYRADVRAVFSGAATVAVVTATVVALLYVVLARLLLLRPSQEVVIGALCASYVNTNNLGIPLLVLVVGSAAVVAPVMLFQVLVMMPLSFIALDLLTGRGGTSRWRVRLAATRNPLVVSVALGFVVAAVGWHPPEIVMAPIEMLGGAAVPLMLLAFGLSLYGAPLPGRGRDSGAMWLAVVLKTVAAPAIAYAVGARLFGLDGRELLTAMVVAALPSAQNIFVHAVRYGVSFGLAREAVLLTTLLSLPLILLITAIFA